ncbi:ATP-binding protein [Aphanothece hegewaldii CCALA 016]|uniref:ATP-binding protein n=1 Tax=Aphanothece hegewaldii CCALA 016 TaxID=2107694 RepID=A0A2T1M3A4_9CHRO|nr:ATP-binding protein [Aphanothece hegewaldii]PSF39323.1 ATP-binding protein [Aphanothece hegewaldii CCALA 016]
MVISPTSNRYAKNMTFTEFTSPLNLFGRQLQFQQMTEALTRDQDILLVGVPGSGRRTLARRAVNAVGTLGIEIDCIRAIDSRRFVQLLYEGIVRASQELEMSDIIPKIQLNEDIWLSFTTILNLLQHIAVSIPRPVVLILHGFPHIRAWDRQGKWETYLREEIKRHTVVSYVLIATIAETSHPSEEISKNLEIITLDPLTNNVVGAWAGEVLNREGLSFDPRSNALQTFLNAVRGHMGDATALIRRLQREPSKNLIGNQEINQAIQELLEDLGTTFESLLMLLPPTQVQLLESLVLDPTDKPQSRVYIDKHSLCRGGSLQGALSGLQNKGLIYGPELGYRLALPLFDLWIHQRLQ